MASPGDILPCAPSETEEERRILVAREAELIAAARERLDAGQGISGAELQAWFKADAETDEPVAVPNVAPRFP